MAGYLDRKIELICKEVDATEPPTLYLTSDDFVIKQLNRTRKLEGLEPLIYKPNFREKLAVTKEYKGTRKSLKPFHYNNLLAYMLANYDCNVANGIEADDAMCIEQTKGLQDGYETIICSRDKDLRQSLGWHFSWECGKQGSIGPIKVEDYGWLEKRSNDKVLGFGDCFFYYQMLVGDSVDAIPGLPSYGTVTAYNLLCSDTSPTDSLGAYELVKGQYQSVYGDDWEVHFNEMSGLLWMIRELDDEGRPILYKAPLPNS